MPALTLFTSSANSLRTDYSPNSGTRPFPLRGPEASKEGKPKHISLA